jgi:hypothetical protein
VAFSIQPLWAPAQLTNAAVAYYTAAARTQIDKITVHNPSTTTIYTATIYWVPSGGAAGTANLMENARPVLPQESWDVFSLIGHTLAIGDAIWALASTTLVLNFFGSGLVMA